MSKKYDGEQPSMAKTLGGFILTGVGVAAGMAAYRALNEVYDAKVEPLLKKKLYNESEKTDKTEE